MQFILWNDSSREGMMNEILSYKKLNLNLLFITALVINESSKIVLEDQRAFKLNENAKIYVEKAVK